jgi:hypothetical protein
MSRVGIAPPPVTITADDKRLKAGKPALDPFLLAADCLGYDPKIPLYSKILQAVFVPVSRVVLLSLPFAQVTIVSRLKISVPIMLSKIWIMLAAK